MKNASMLLLTLMFTGMAGCKEMDLGLDDEARDSLDCMADRDSCGEDNSSGDSSSDADNDDSATIDDGDGSDSAGDAVDSGISDEDDVLDGFVILDSSRKGDQRYLMGTYFKYRYYYGGTMPWHLPVAVRAYSHSNDPLIDFEDADGNLLWVAVATDAGFDFESEVTVNGVERDFDCSCQITYDNWDCTCDLEDSSTEYTLNYDRMGLDPEDVHDSDDYEGIVDEREYVVLSDYSCENNNYELPNNIAVKYCGETIDFETDDGELLWTADLHEDETFDFTIGGFPDDYGRPNVDLGCTCEVWTTALSGVPYEITRDNDLHCYCASTEGVDCDVTYY